MKTFNEKMNELARLLKEGHNVIYLRARQDGRVRQALKERGIDLPTYKKPDDLKGLKSVDEIMWEAGDAQREAEAKQMNDFIKNA